MTKMRISKSSQKSIHSVSPLVGRSPHKLIFKKETNE
jgi:hypothetical protein